MLGLSKEGGRMQTLELILVMLDYNLHHWWSCPLACNACLTYGHYLLKIMYSMSK